MAKVYLENKGKRLITIGDVQIKPTFIGEIDDSTVSAKALQHYLNNGELVKVTRPAETKKETS